MRNALVIVFVIVFFILSRDKKDIHSQPER